MIHDTDMRTSLLDSLPKVLAVEKVLKVGELPIQLKQVARAAAVELWDYEAVAPLSMAKRTQWRT